MHEHQYLIIGGGMAADAAARGILEVDKTAGIGMICAEEYPPYNRPPLSKSLWKGKKESGIWRRTEDLSATLYLDRSATSIDTETKTVSDNQGGLYRYEKLLLATGGEPRQLQSDGGEILYYRKLSDYYRLRKAVELHKHFAVIGGGFIGSEIAAALALQHREVTMIFPEGGIGGRIFPAEISAFLNGYYAEHGISIRSNCMVSGVRSANGFIALKLDDGSEIVAGAAVAGLGIRLNLDLARAAGLETSRGILVNEFLQTSNPDIYAAGDVAEIYNSSLDTGMTVEHEENANMTGYLAGQAMAGQPQPYDYLPYVYSDLFDISYEGVGILDSSLEILCDWREPFDEGIIYYLDKGRIRGVLAWNLQKKMNAARRLINDPGPFNVDDLRGKL